MSKKKRRDQSDYHVRMRGFNPAHRLAHKLNTSFERFENYLDEIKGDNDPWEDSEEIIEKFEQTIVLLGQTIDLLRNKPKDYVPRKKITLVPAVGATVQVLPKFREDYDVVFDADEMDELTIVDMKAGRIFVQPPGDTTSKPIPMRKSEVKVVKGGKPKDE